MTTLVWFRQDLRLADNPALSAAHAAGGAVVPVYVFAPGEESSWAPGGASRWWLHQALAGLAETLGRQGSKLCLRASDDTLGTLQALVRETGATRVFWNRRYEPAAIARDQAVKTALRAQGLDTQSFNASLLNEPWTVRTKTGGPFQVFTPFWRHCKALGSPPAPLPVPPALKAPAAWPASERLEALELLPKLGWAAEFAQAWSPGSEAAHALIERFLQDSLEDYGTRRDRPDLDRTSRLSPYLHFGEIGPREIFHAVRRHAEAHGRHSSWRDSQFLTEVGWREFAYHLLYHFPATPEAPLREAYSRFPWRANDEALIAWQRGQTGYPIVDAGMRQLWRTGWMHNRVRMIAASFLVKDLLQPWTVGAHWFWDTLVDADLASNTLGWQWVAGCGADAAPYFRIFNPVSQGTKFDPDGRYVRRWVPELARLPNDWLHEPWAAPPEVLKASGVSLGSDYPRPVVDHGEARKNALAALASIKR